MPQGILAAAFLIPVVVGGLLLVLYGLSTTNRILPVPTNAFAAELCRSGSLLTGAILLACAMGTYFGPERFFLLGGLVGAIYSILQLLVWLPLRAAELPGEGRNARLYVGVAAMIALACSLLTIAAGLMAASWS
jgi:hypothetical protein